MEQLVNWIRHKTIWVLTAFISIFGTMTARLATCTQQTTIVATRIATNPANQVAVVESASFVANLFYEGTDDPFATSGAGGEAGKLTHVVLKKGEKLFGNALSKIIGKTDEIIRTSRTWASPQIQEGKRAIQKKIGHAPGKGINSAFNKIEFTQQNAEKLINNIINKADAIIIRPQKTIIYTPTGQGLSIKTRTGKFIGFAELSLEKEL